MSRGPAALPAARAAAAGACPACGGPAGCREGAPPAACAERPCANPPHPAPTHHHPARPQPCPYSTWRWGWPWCACGWPGAASCGPTSSSCRCGGLPRRRVLAHASPCWCLWPCHLQGTLLGRPAGCGSPAVRWSRQLMHRPPCMHLPQMWAFGFPTAALAWAAVLYDLTIDTALRWVGGWVGGWARDGTMWCSSQVLRPPRGRWLVQPSPPPHPGPCSPTRAPAAPSLSQQGAGGGPDRAGMHCVLRAHAAHLRRRAAPQGGCRGAGCGRVQSGRGCGRGGSCAATLGSKLACCWLRLDWRLQPLHSLSATLTHPALPRCSSPSTSEPAGLSRLRICQAWSAACCPACSAGGGQPTGCGARRACSRPRSALPSPPPQVGPHEPPAAGPGGAAPHAGPADRHGGWGRWVGEVG